MNSSRKLLMSRQNKWYNEDSEIVISAGIFSFLPLTPTYCNTKELKDRLYEDLSNLQKTKLSDVAIIVNNINDQAGGLSGTERYSGVYFGISAKWTETGDHFFNYFQTSLVIVSNNFEQ